MWNTFCKAEGEIRTEQDELFVVKSSLAPDKTLLMIYSCWCHHVPFPVLPMTTDKSVKASVSSHLLQVSKQEQNPGQSVLKMGWAGGLLPCLPGPSITAFELNVCIGSWSLVPALPGFGVTWFKWMEDHRWTWNKDLFFFFCLNLLFLRKKQVCIPIFFHDSGSHVRTCTFPLLQQNL